MNIALKSFNSSSFLKSFFNDTLIYGFSDAIFKALGILTFPIFAHILTVDQYGVIELALTFSALSSIFYVGIHNAIQRFYWEQNISQEERVTLISTGLGLLMSATVIISLLFIGIISLFQNYLWESYHIEIHYIVIALLTILPNQICIFTQCWLRLQFAPWKFMLLSASLNILSVLFSLTFLVWLKLGITGFLVGGLLANLGIVPLSFWLMRKELRFAFDFSVLKEIVSFGYPFIFTSVAYWIFGTMDRWMIGWLSDVHQVGLYSVAFKITMVLNIVRAAFSQAWSPHALKMYNSLDNYQSVYSRVLSVWFYTLLLIGTTLSLFAPEFFWLTTPKEYWDVTSVVVFTIAGLVMNSTTEVTAVGISLKKKTYLFTKGSWLTALVNFGLNYLLIPQYGALGAAVATFVSYCILTLYYLYHSQKLNPLPLEYNQLLSTIGVLLTSICVCLWASNQALNLNMFLLKIIYIALITALAFGFKIIPFPKFQLRRLFSRSKKVAKYSETS